MKALSIKGDWCILIRDGIKTIETRTWATKHRGDLLLCASQQPKTELSGKAFAVVELLDCQPMTEDHVEAACCEVYDRAVSWFLGNLRLIEPFPVKGQLSLFEVPDDQIVFIQ